MRMLVSVPCLKYCLERVLLATMKEQEFYKHFTPLLFEPLSRMVNQARSKNKNPAQNLKGDIQDKYT